MEQKIIYRDGTKDGSDYIKDWLKGKKVLLVCENFLDSLEIAKSFEGADVVRFSGYSSNPTYESVVDGVKTYRANNCDAIAVVGGGSAIDVAKCIKLYNAMDDGEIYLKQEIVPNTIPFLAVPTTAGTGSEATRFAVIYYKGEKQSVTHISSIPDTVVFDSSILINLPLYQKKATMMDALCHAIESFWSVNSTDESKGYAKEAIEIILANYEAYLNCEDEALKNMFKAANLSGKAINISQTTAGHAMCYKLTSLYGLSHGHAACFCVRKLWPYMLSNTDKCIDPRGEEYLKGVFDEIATAMGCKSSSEAASKFAGIVDFLDLKHPEPKPEDFDILKTSVNPVRLKNNPVGLDEEVIEKLYHEILD